MIMSFLQKPLYQMLFVQGLSLLAMLAYRPQNVNSLWTVAGLFYILFIVINSLFIWFAPRVWMYFFSSVGFSVLYMLLAYLISSAISGLFKLEGSGESSMIFLVIIYHPFALLLVIFLNWLYHKLF